MFSICFLEGKRTRKLWWVCWFGWWCFYVFLGFVAVLLGPGHISIRQTEKRLEHVKQTGWIQTSNRNLFANFHLSLNQKLMKPMTPKSIKENAGQPKKNFEHSESHQNQSEAEPQRPQKRYFQIVPQKNQYIPILGVFFESNKSRHFFLAKWKAFTESQVLKHLAEFHPRGVCGALGEVKRILAKSQGGAVETWETEQNQKNNYEYEVSTSLETIEG